MGIISNIAIQIPCLTIQIIFQVLEYDLIGCLERRTLLFSTPNMLSSFLEKLLNNPDALSNILDTLFNYLDNDLGFEKWLDRVSRKNVMSIQLFKHVVKISKHLIQCPRYLVLPSRHMDNIYYCCREVQQRNKWLCLQ